jgi:hypothetical protein
VPAATRAALRREFALTCRVLDGIATELADGGGPVAAPSGRRDAGA